MEFVKPRSSSYGTHTHIVRLDEEELNWSDLRLITAADRHGILSDEDWEKIDNGAHPHHFGGHVEKRSGKRTSATYAKISVYFD